MFHDITVLGGMQRDTVHLSLQGRGVGKGLVASILAHISFTGELLSGAPDEVGTKRKKVTSK
jgi:hypothetical protein